MGVTRARRPFPLPRVGDNAAEILGTSTKKATVEAALRAATAKQARAREFAAVESGEPDLSRVREEAWR